jgi:hypothetical protein
VQANEGWWAESNAHRIEFSGTSILDTKTGYKDHPVKEATEIKLNTENFNRGGGFTLSQPWYPLQTCSPITKQDQAQQALDSDHQPLIGSQL